MIQKWWTQFLDLLTGIHPARPQKPSSLWHAGTVCISGTFNGSHVVVYTDGVMFINGHPAIPVSGGSYPKKPNTCISTDSDGHKFKMADGRLYLNGVEHRVEAK